MKKYIAPTAKKILLGAESNMLLNGSNNYADEEGFQQYSNKRECTVSEQIWGFEEEDESSLFF